MPLLITGKKFIRDLETSGALAVRAPLEGGFEGRYQRRLRAAGYESINLTVKGLGDLSAYLTDVHGVRPAHLGKKTIGQSAAVGYRYYIPPVVNYRLEQLPQKAKGLVLWLIEGNILSQQEIAYLTQLPTAMPNVKVVLEMGGDRVFSWQPLKNELAA
ncbi:NAD(P)H-quinone oxidoreductase subunit N [Oscillatoria sp. CS-180]|uniref:NAD(P)H-quinone oxidoreductase subunit N n=1 Tax=Oscillatoria sp. CS-180 TaxID=3021720 RepID=UPI0023308FBB|nr:NAD(P)H-quinone oxidoreductase subunit N [Oscillatoria sp. CS-180]MDB9524615.1 NAD(P)H-quinone oxidoreductase subunit N [Oscillatoria sp. CS-180]